MLSVNLWCVCCVSGSQYCDHVGVSDTRQDHLTHRDHLGSAPNLSRKGSSLIGSLNKFCVNLQGWEIQIKLFSYNYLSIFSCLFESSFQWQQAEQGSPHCTSLSPVTSSIPLVFPRLGGFGGKKNFLLHCHTFSKWYNIIITVISWTVFYEPEHHHSQHRDYQEHLKLKCRNNQQMPEILMFTISRPDLNSNALDPGGWEVCECVG